jgi:tetratricopeptide (TPR) repeat protein
MLSLGNVIEPFQNRLSAFFLYPFQLTPLLLTLALSLVGALFPSSILVSLFVWIVMMKYAYETLIVTGRGALEAPGLSWDLINSDVMQVFKQYVIFAIVIFCAVAAFQHTGMVGGFTFLTLIFLAIPAIIMLLVATNSVLHAINPIYFMGIIARIGWPYFLMYLFLFFLMAAPATLFSYLPPDILPLKVYIFLTLFLKQFYALISYHLMGYVLLQYHREIGYQVDYEFFMANRGSKKKRSNAKPEDELTIGLAVLVKCGKYNEAIERLLPYINEKKPSLELSEKFLQLLKMSGQRERYLKYSLRHLDCLVRENKKQKALSSYKDILAEGAGVPTAESLFQLGAWYRERNEFKKAIDVFVCFAKQYRQHALQPAVYFELAKLLHEHGNNSIKARQILSTIVKSHPEHTLAADVKKYLLAVSSACP